MLGLISFCTSCTCWTIYLKIKSIKRLNIIFDLDNTLIMSLDRKKYITMKHSHKPNIYMVGRVVWLRPWSRQVIYILSKISNLYLFTKAEQTYADSILEEVGITHYFKICKYKQDCLINKDIGKFSSSYKKLIDYYYKIKKLDSDHITDIEYIQNARNKVFQSIKSHSLKLSKFINETILIDDKITNKLPGQNFYHIDFFHFGMIWDIEMIKLLLWIYWKTIYAS